MPPKQLKIKQKEKKQEPILDIKENVAILLRWSRSRQRFEEQ